MLYHLCLYDTKIDCVRLNIWWFFDLLCSLSVTEGLEIGEKIRGERLEYHFILITHISSTVRPAQHCSSKDSVTEINEKKGEKG